MASCAVANCRGGDNVLYHPLPIKNRLRRQWIQICNQPDNFNARTTNICSFHFTSDDYENDKKNTNSNQNSLRRLKPDAVPSVNIPFYQECSSIEAERANRAQKREIRQYLLDTERRFMCKIGRLDRVEHYTNAFLRTSEVYNSSHAPVSPALSFYNAEKKGEIGRLNKIIRKLMVKNAKLEKACKYWHEVATARGKMQAKLKLQKRKLQRELTLCRNSAVNSSTL